MAHVPRFDPATLTSSANDTSSVRRVFGEAYERGGVTVVPVARVWAATGLGLGDGESGGSLPVGDWARRVRERFGRGAEALDDAGASGDEAEDEDDDTAPHGGYGAGHGGGGGYGAVVRPVGVYVIDEHGAHWRPALDLNRVILGGQLVAATALVSIGAALAVKAVADALATSVTAVARR